MKNSRRVNVETLFAGTMMLMLVMICVPVSAANQPVTLQVVNGEVRDVLTALARLSGTNIVVDDTVVGKITMQVEGLELETALQLIAKTKGLEYHKIGNVIIVGKREAINRNFGQMQVFSLNYADPMQAAAAATLAIGEITDENIAKDETNDGQTEKQRTQEVTEDRGKISRRLVIDEATNSLLFFGTPSEGKTIGDLLKKIDVPYQQVLLEAKVVAIQKDAAKNLGIEWEWSKLPQTPEIETSYETVTQTITDANGDIKTITEQKPKTTITRKWKDGSENVPGIISFGHAQNGQPFEFYYAAQLNALIMNGKANVLARPNIMTINGREAIINIGGEVPVPMVSVTNSTTTTSLAYREAGIILKYTPRINHEGFITAVVHTEVSSPLYVAELKAYRFNKRSADTVVRLKDGETMVIGGLIGSEESSALSKVPFLGDLPILGSFFRHVKESKTESEVMIFLTATIVN